LLVKIPIEYLDIARIIHGAGWIAVIVIMKEKRRAISDPVSTISRYDHR